MLRITSFSKRFNRITAVDNFNLSVDQGEFLVLLGPSGCGKTTVLRLIAGLESLDTGTISMSGKEWTELPPQKRDVAMVFQQYALYPQRTVRGNIEYPLRLRGMNSGDCRRKIEWISSFLDIASFLDRKPRELSGGEAQRVALARALVRDPACFLMDEPLSNLDTQLRIRARAEIKKLQRELKVTTLYVTHDQEDAVALADRIAIMNKGRLIQIGTAEGLFQRPATSFVAQVLGRPPMNLLKGTVIGEERGLPVVGLETSNGSNPSQAIRLGRTPPKGRKLLVGFRPNQVKLAKEERPADVEQSWSVPGKIVLVEGLALEYVAHYDTPTGTLLVRTDIKPAESLNWLILPAASAHFFDAETGERFE